MPTTARTTRRSFIQTIAAGTAGAGLSFMLPSAAYARFLRANESITVGIIGTGGRGAGLARNIALLADADVAYVCDVDERRVAEAQSIVSGIEKRTPTAVTDFRRILDDPAVDAVVIATPDHWHTPAAILALQAGKHVYVEKPGSHNAGEAELIVQAAQQYGRQVQMGNQRRSWPKVVEGVEQVRQGLIGPVHYARGWYANKRNSIGHGKQVAVPDWLDYELWQGPAPRQPYRDNILHYNWHWFWNWGTGEAGNNGVHAVDLCRWGLGVDYPTQVNSSGGRYFWDDDQETPDTQVISFNFEGEKSILWEGLSSNFHGLEGESFGATFHGENGTVHIQGEGYREFDRDNKLVQHVVPQTPDDPLDTTGPGYLLDAGHLANFRDAIRSGDPLVAPIADGQKSTLLCHLGNIAQRTGRTLHCDPQNGHILNDADAMKLWGREYAPGWQPQV